MQCNLGDSSGGQSESAAVFSWHNLLPASYIQHTPSIMAGVLKGIIQHFEKYTLVNHFFAES